MTPSDVVLHWRVPTSKPRVVVTESAELAQALDAAAQRWPGESRSALLVRLALQAAQAARAEQERQVEERLRQIDRWSGAFSNSYDAELLTALRSEWPP